MSGASSTTRSGDDRRSSPPRCTVDGQASALSRDDLRRATSRSCRRGRGEASRRSSRSRRRAWSTTAAGARPDRRGRSTPSIDGVLGRPRPRAYAERGPSARRARLHATCSSTTPASHLQRCRARSPSRNQQQPERQHERLHPRRSTARALTGRPAGMAVTTHLCHGRDPRSSWHAEDGYDYVAEAPVRRPRGRRLLPRVRRRALPAASSRWVSSRPASRWCSAS